MDSSGPLIDPSSFGVTDLATLLETLPATEDGAGGDRFRVQIIPGLDSHYIGRDARGAPCLLLKSIDTGMRAPIRLEAIEVRFAMPCLVSKGDSAEGQETLTVVICRAQDQQTERYFLHVCETILRIVGPRPTFEAVSQAMQRLVDLFRRLALPPSRSLVGLIGEMIVLSGSADAVVAAQAWRSAVDDRFDFSTPALRLEVKASAARSRTHEFSQEQCSPPDGVEGVLASMFVESSGGGTSLLDLIRRIEGRLAGRDDLITKVQDAVSETLGVSLPVALTARFDEGLARASLQFYDLASVPAIRGVLPPGVSRLRFQSDLSRIPPLDRPELNARGEALAGLLPL